MRFTAVLFIMLAWVYTPVAQAALNVFACEPEWAALAQEVGADKLDIYTATTAHQDPHHIEARPSLIAKARSADLLVCTGAELEIGWLPQVLRQSGNAKIQPGQPGYFEAASFVTRIEIPTSVDRSLGDVHAQGNPHVHTDPHNILQIAAQLVRRLQQLDATNAVFYAQRHAEFKQRWQQAIPRWEAQAAVLKGLPVIVQHRTFSYLLKWLGMSELASLEPKQGFEPTTAHLLELKLRLKQQPARLAIRSTLNDPRATNWLTQQVQIPVVVLPATVGANDQAMDLYTYFDNLIAQLLKASRGS